MPDQRAGLDELLPRFRRLRGEMVSIALFQPDIPQNCGTIMRLGACLGVAVEVIGPAGFDLSDRRLRRAGLDYLDHLELVRHAGWPAFLSAATGAGRRIVLMSTRGATSYCNYRFDATDALLLGRESGGVPDEVHDAADATLRLPMVAGMRSLNVATAAAMVLGEALRQVQGFPET